jgi:PilZ domain
MMEGQLHIAPDVRLLVEQSRCAADSCDELAAIDFDGRSLCVDHFLPACTGELEARNTRLRNLPFDSAATDAFKEFIARCARQAEKLAADARFAQGHAKAGLLDFLLRMSQLSRHIRRSPRAVSSVPIWLRREDPYQTWHEETWTVTLSRHGAGLLCRRPVQQGGTVFLCRKDKGSRAAARVVYCGHDAQGRKQIGVQFCDSIDFWDLG